MKFLNSFICSVSQLWHANQIFFVRTVCHLWHVDHIVCMGESTSIFIRRFVKLKCAYGDLRILTISRIKIYIFVLIYSAIWSYPYTWPLADPCFLKLTHAHGVARSGENCCELAGSLLNTFWESPEQFEKKCHVYQRAMSFPSPLTKM